MDIATNFAGFTCLVMPVIFYHYYTRDNPLASLWVKYMRVDSDQYFSFMLPAVMAMALSFRIPMGRLDFNKNPSIYIDNVKAILKQKPTIGLMLIGAGLVSGVLDFLAPESLKQIFYFLAHLTYVGAFYVLYSPSKNKKTILPIIGVLMMLQTIATGMFGDFVLMLICSIVLILIGEKIPFYRKFFIMALGLFFILIIQSVKPEYRQKVWNEGTGGDVTYYASLVSERIVDPTIIFDPDKLFFVGVRMNQGWLVANTMYYVPTRFDFAHGETIWQSLAAAIVPRFLWPDKPEAGGRANLKRFWGVDISGFSMNVGPFGEGYGNFDIAGGIIYMFFYGLFFNIVLSFLMRFCEKRPTFVLWIPFLFFNSIAVETDTLSTMGSLVKGLIFTWLIYRFFKIAFRIEL